MASSESGLFPGYRHVDAFGPDEEYESGEEVEYVTLDLGTIEPTLVPSSSSFRIIGLDTPTPYLQLSGTKLKGQHQSLLGTELLFTEASDESQQHSAHGKKPLVPVATTERRIRFKEIELKPKGDGAATDVPSASTSKSTTAKKVKTQMDHVMGNHSDTPRRGRGGKKRGGTTKAQTPTQSRVASSTGRKESVDEPTDQSTESQRAPAVDAIDPALIQMDMSEG
ncbi:hypothetical protein BN946_scf184998.g44 [Trametes cinnabarina]|uniref:Transcription factor TFIIIC triple barrel domain-containing protein n=1 Tax=Pycnoporus cinnabarinus TaxID=5643 RepID=A0A060S2D5_PYCCI|nr:hypothetical protein BN946_scf184998.g44 [Trametes cinnabarina]